MRQNVDITTIMYFMTLIFQMIIIISIFLDTSLSNSTPLGMIFNPLHPGTAGSAWMDNFLLKWLIIKLYTQKFVLRWT